MEALLRELAEAALEEAAEVQGDDNDIFVYDGTQPVPDRVRRARIHKDVKIIPRRAFYRRYHLIYVEFHDGVEIIEEQAFNYCNSLRSAIKLLGVKIISRWAFDNCHRLTDVEFGDKLETIEIAAFRFCTHLKNIKLPSVRTIGSHAFAGCDELFDVEFGEALTTLSGWALSNCPKLERIALPLKDGMIGGDGVFTNCPMLTTIDLVGGIHSTVASLHMENWRNEMTGEISRINQTLPNTAANEKTGKIQQWMESVFDHLEHYKAEHKALLKEATTLLELALWKANRDDNNGGEGEREGVRTLAEVENAMAAMRVTSGADVVIKNVLPFLKLE